MTVTQMANKLVRFYPKNPCDSPAQKAWRMASGCSPDQPCRRWPCSACSAAAMKIFLKRVQRLNRQHPKLELMAISFEKEVDLQKITGKTFRKFRSHTLTCIGDSEICDHPYVGMFSIDPVWLNENRYEDGARLNECKLCLRIYLPYDSYYEREWLLE